MDDKKITQKVVRGFAWQGGARLFMQVFAWLVTIFVARILLPEDYGIVATAGLVTELMVIVTEMGLAEGLINKNEVTKDEYDSVFWFSILVGIFLYIVVFFSAPLIAEYYRLAILTDVIRVSGIVMIFASLKVIPIAKSMRNLDFKFRSLVEVSGQIVMGVVVLAFAINGMGVWSLVAGPIAFHLVTALAYSQLIYKDLPGLTLSLEKTKGILLYGSKLMVSRMLGFVMNKSPILILGVGLDMLPEDRQKIVGYYQMAVTLAKLPLDKIGSIFNNVAFPALSRLKHDKPRLAEMFLDLHKYLLVAAFPLLLGFAFVADDIIILLLTEKWRPIITLLQILCLVNLLRVSGMIMLPLLKACGNADRVLMFHIIGVIITPLIFWLLLPYELLGTAYASLLSFVPLYIYLLYSNYKELNISLTVFLRSFRHTLVASFVMSVLLMVFFVMLSDSNPLLRLFAMIAAGAISYAGVYFVFYKEEILRMKRGFLMLKSGNKEQ